jgi:adenine-specific DNA-methyltransferase
MDYSDKTKDQLIAICREKGVTGYTNKRKDALLLLLQEEPGSNEAGIEEDAKENYVSQPNIIYIGNKRKLIHNIYEIVNEVRLELGKDKLNIVDGFAGTSIVSRQLSYIANRLYVNDLEFYSYVIAQCYLQTPTKSQRTQLAKHFQAMNELAENGPYIEGIVTQLYAPADTSNPKKDERCFYTHENALIIDTLREYIDTDVTEDLRPYCLGPLLHKATIHSNTASVFKGFFKRNGVGHFGTARMFRPIRVEMPVWRSEVEVICSNRNINDLVQELPDDIDLIYIDPPHNSHPYGSNYFMLNLIATNEAPAMISRVSGIPTNWLKSAYNRQGASLEAMRDLITDGLKKSKYLLCSYQVGGYITADDWILLCEPYAVKKYVLGETDVMYLISRA